MIILQFIYSINPDRYSGSFAGNPISYTIPVVIGQIKQELIFIFVGRQSDTEKPVSLLARIVSSDDDFFQHGQRAIGDISTWFRPWTDVKPVIPAQAETPDLGIHYKISIASDLLAFPGLVYQHGSYYGKQVIMGPGSEAGATGSDFLFVRSDFDQAGQQAWFLAFI